MNKKAKQLKTLTLKKIDSEFLNLIIGGSSNGTGSGPKNQKAETEQKTPEKIDFKKTEVKGV